MSQRLQEAEQALSDLRTNGVSSPSSRGDTAHTAQEHEPLDDTAASPLLDPPVAEETEMLSPSIDVRSVGASSDARDARDSLGRNPAPSLAIPTVQRYSLDGSAPAQDTAAVTQPTAKNPAPNDLSIDENGKIVYYGPTSAVHDPPFHMETPLSTASTVGTNVSSRAEKRTVIAAHARESATWEEFAVGNASLETGIPRHLMAKLLHVYWTWVSPMFMWVYRPAFVRKYMGKIEPALSGIWEANILIGILTYRRHGYGRQILLRLSLGSHLRPRSQVRRQKLG